MLRCRLRIASLILLVIPGSVLAQGASKQHAQGVDFIGQYIDVEAIGVPPDRLPVGGAAAYADAQRAAYVLAERNLAELLSGLYIQSSTSFSDAGARDFADKVEADLLRTHVQGGQIVDQSSLETFKRENRVRLIVRYPLAGNIPSLMQSVGPRLRQVEKTLPAAPPPPPVTARPSYDGLIVKIPDGFQPTIAPKIYNSKGQLVYGANSLAMDVLVAQGVAQFTNQPAKAKTALEAHGAKEIITVSGTLHPGNKDVDITDKDAATILGASAQTNFLQKGRVYIVIGGGT
jgi:hypothetical protein